ncbi:MAG: hypothetical protein HY093_00665 [Candidatus Liptonbacteria bacterium]|nr:hypothetical protein [Candidatus Liptonbacteria bacterium]
MKKYKYYCRSCEEVFYVNRANMNEKHHCGSFSLMDWTYDGSEEEKSKE